MNIGGEGAAVLILLAYALIWAIDVKGGAWLKRRRG